MILVQVMLGAEPHLRTNILRHDYCFFLKFLINLLLIQVLHPISTAEPEF
jgi:hypothetical protein